MNEMKNETRQATPNQKLFDKLNYEWGILPTESEMNDIRNICKEIESNLTDQSDGEWKPVYGEEIEGSDNEAHWFKVIFLCVNPIKNYSFTYITISDAGAPYGYRYIRPIRKSLREEIHEILIRNNSEDHFFKGTVDEIMTAIDRAGRG